MAPRSRCLVRAVSLLALGFFGCSEELGPERFTTTKVHGVVRIGNRPVGGGWISFDPDSGVQGLLRIAPIHPDGSFEIDRVPRGRVIVAIDQIPNHSDQVSVRAFRFTRSPIRRTIPEGRDIELSIDLIEEAIKLQGGVKRSRRKRNRSGPKVKELARPKAPANGVREDGSIPHEPRVRVVYCEGSGKVHLNWPSDQVATAIADLEGTVWIDIEDLESANNASVEAMLHDVFRFHPLAIEDALKDTHVPKVDDWSRFLYIVVDTLDFHPETDELRLHELDLFLGPNYLVSYHNETTEVLERHRRNLEREPEDRLKLGASHLLYRILDEVVAEFLPAIEHLDNEIDEAQDEVFDVPTPKTLRRIFQIKRNALRLHRVVIPIREVMNRLARDPYAQIKIEDRIYFRDVYDDLVRIHDIVESLRDLIAGALDTYLSVVSNRTNEIMKALTLVNVMFLPMSFVAGFFGMNFFGETLMFVSPVLPKAVLFWLACSIMIGTPVGMALMAWRRGWF